MNDLPPEENHGVKPSGPTRRNWLQYQRRSCAALDPAMDETPLGNTPVGHLPLGNLPVDGAALAPPQAAMPLLPVEGPREWPSPAVRQSTGDPAAAEDTLIPLNPSRGGIIERLVSVANPPPYRHPQATGSQAQGRTGQSVPATAPAPQRPGSDIDVRSGGDAGAAPLLTSGAAAGRNILTAKSAGSPADLDAERVPATLPYPACEGMTEEEMNAPIGPPRAARTPCRVNDPTDVLLMASALNKYGHAELAFAGYEDWVEPAQGDWEIVLSLQNEAAYDALVFLVRYLNIVGEAGSLFLTFRTEPHVRPIKAMLSGSKRIAPLLSIVGDIGEAINPLDRAAMNRVMRRVASVLADCPGVTIEKALADRVGDHGERLLELHTLVDTEELNPKVAHRIDEYRVVPPATPLVIFAPQTLGTMAEILYLFAVVDHSSAQVARMEDAEREQFNHSRPIFLTWDDPQFLPGQEGQRDGLVRDHETGALVTKRACYIFHETPPQNQLPWHQQAQR